jgi:hypothetical protein
MKRRIDEDAWIKQKALEEDSAFVSAGYFAPIPSRSIVTIARKAPFKALRSELPRPLALAADTEAPEEVVVLTTEQDQPMARLFYDYQRATLNLEFLHAVPFGTFDAEIRLMNGDYAQASQVAIRDQKATLLSKTDLTEDDIAQVRLLPQGSQ